MDIIDDTKHGTRRRKQKHIILVMSIRYYRIGYIRVGFAIGIVLTDPN